MDAEILSLMSCGKKQAVNQAAKSIWVIKDTLKETIKGIKTKEEWSKLAAFGKLKYILKSDIGIRLKTKFFNECVLLILMYSAKRFSMTKRLYKNYRQCREKWLELS